MRTIVVLALVAATLMSAAPVRATSPADRLAGVVQDILDQPYQPEYVPVGYDTASDLHDHLAAAMAAT